MDTAVTLEFGDGTYRFWLPMARIVEIERLCGDKSILVMHSEFSSALEAGEEDEKPTFVGGSANVKIRDLYEVIRCAAIGGNQCEVAGKVSDVSPIDAKRLAANYVDGRPFVELVEVAFAILDAAIRGVKVKKKADSAAEAFVI